MTQWKCSLQVKGLVGIVVKPPDGSNDCNIANGWVSFSSTVAIAKNVYGKKKEDKNILSWII